MPRSGHIELDEALSQEELAAINAGPFQPDSPFGLSVALCIFGGQATEEERALFTQESLADAWLKLHPDIEIDERLLLGS